MFRSADMHGTQMPRASTMKRVGNAAPVSRGVHETSTKKDYQAARQIRKVFDEYESCVGWWQQQYGEVGN